MVDDAGPAGEVAQQRRVAQVAAHQFDPRRRGQVAGPGGVAHQGENPRARGGKPQSERPADEPGGAGDRRNHEITSGSMTCHDLLPKPSRTLKRVQVQGARRSGE